MAKMLTPEERAVASAVARNARRVVEKSGKSMSQFAADHNIPFGTMYQFCSEKDLPTLYTTIRMACAMDVSLDWLCGLNNMDEEEPNEQSDPDRAHSE